MKLFKRLQLKPGFSLIEILAVFFIIATTLTGVVSLIIQNIQVQSINRNNLIASSLAQEGVELIRQTRDANWKAGNYYLTNLNDGSYIIDYRLNTPQLLSGSIDSKIYLQNGFYINATGGEVNLTPTIFNRQVILEKQTSYGGLPAVDAPLQVRVLISWTDRQRPYNYELRALLFNWK